MQDEFLLRVKRVEEGTSVLRMIRSMHQLDFRALMEIYVEGNRENGADNYLDEPPYQQLLLAEQDFHQYLRECFFPVPGAFYAVWLHQGRYVSALRMEPYQDGLLLEALETAPEYRRNGFASALIRAAVQEVKGKKVYSHVNKRNIPSLKTHEACGFRKILDYAVYADGSVLRSSVTLCFEP